MKMVFDNKGKPSEMIETILTYDPPHELSFQYDAPGVVNIMRNYFTEKNGKTIWLSENEFNTDFIQNILFILMKGVFKKETLKGIELFDEAIRRQK
jgi:hypothetical protein